MQSLNFPCKLFVCAEPPKTIALKNMDWPPNSRQDWLMTHADPSIMFSFHFSFNSLGIL